MTSFRMQRINKQIQREISLLLEQRVKNEAAKNAIITGVDCTRDLESARIYFTTLDPAARDEVKKSLDKAAGALRTMLGRQLTLRKTPALAFFLDTSEEYGREMDRILDSLVYSEPEYGDDASDGEKREDEE